METQGVKLSPTQHRDVREFPPFTLDLDERVLLRDGQPVDITAKALALLVALVARHGQIVSKETLMQEVWSNVSVGQANLPTQILFLRRALGEFGDQYVKNIPGRGYRFSAPVINARLEEPVPEVETGFSKQFAEPGPEQPLISNVANVASGQTVTRRSLRKRWTVSILATLVLFAVGLATYRVWSARTPARSTTETLFPGATRLGPRVLTTIEVPGGADRALLSPHGVQLYLAKEERNTLSIIDTQSNTVAAVIPVGNNPVALAVSPDGRTVYVGLKREDIALVDVASRHVTSIHTGGNPLEDITITADGRTLYLALGFSGLRRVDLATDRVSNVSSIAYARHLALTPDNTTLYVSYQVGGPGGSWGRDAIGYFDTKTDRLLGSIHGFPNVGEYLTVSPDGSQLWENGGDACILASYDHVGCAFVPAALVNIISTRDNKLIKAVALQGALTNSISFFPGGPAVIAAVETLVLIDTKQFSIVGSVPIRSLGNLAVTEDGSLAYVPLSGEKKVAVLELVRHVPAIALSTLSESAETFPIAILNTKDFDPKSVDPTTLTLNGTSVQRTFTGTLTATHQHIQSLDKYDLVVNFPAAGLKPGTNAALKARPSAGSRSVV